MQIRCWGSRGSIPVSGRDYLRYGGDTTCIEIRNGADDVIIVDAGTGIRRLGNALVQESRLRCHLIFTHAHWDHVQGFPFFKPIFMPRAELILHKCPFQSKFVESILGKVMSPPAFPVRYRDLTARIRYQEACPVDFAIGPTTITPVPLSHPNSGSGYRFAENGRAFVFLTDNELGFIHPGGLARDAYVEFCMGADLLIHDAEYTPREYRTTREWGHSTCTDAVDLALAAGVRRLGLFHINQDRSDDGVDRMVAACRRRIAKAGRHLECFAVAADMTFSL